MKGTERTGRKEENRAGWTLETLVGDEATDEEILSLSRPAIILGLFWGMGSFVTFYVIIAIDKHIHFLRK